MEKLTKSGGVYQENSFVYYQKQTDLADGMRAFNNWIKTNIILTYCKNRPSVLDFGCGRGGDLIKFINANIGEYVGVDNDNNGLYIIKNNAFSRYKNLKRPNKSTTNVFHPG